MAGELAHRTGPHWPLRLLGHPELGDRPPPWEQPFSWGGIPGGRVPNKGEEDMVMDTCARRALTSVQTQSGAVNGNLPSASSHCPVSLLRWAGSTRQRSRGSIDGCWRLSDRSLTHTRAAPQPPAGARFSVNGEDQVNPPALPLQRCETMSGNIRLPQRCWRGLVWSPQRHWHWFPSSDKVA